MIITRLQDIGPSLRALFWTEINPYPQSPVLCPFVGIQLCELRPAQSLIYDPKHVFTLARDDPGIGQPLQGITSIVLGVSYFQAGSLKEKEYQKAKLQQQLENITLRVDQSLILKLVDDIQSKNKEILVIGKKYIGMAVISEIADLTPANVRLLSLSAELNNIPKGKKGKKGKKEEKNRDLVISGIVKGDRLAMESTLASYLMGLNNSPLFDRPTISKKSFGRYEDQEVLNFTARLILL